MKNVMKQARKRDGFTIIEVLVAIVILGVITAAVLTLLPSVVNINQDSSSDVDVTVEARSYLETVRASLPIIAGENGPDEETAFERVAASATGTFQNLYTAVTWDTSTAPWNNTPPPDILSDANTLPSPPRFTCATRFVDPDQALGLGYSEVVRLRFEFTCTETNAAEPTTYQYFVDVGRPE